MRILTYKQADDTLQIAYENGFIERLNLSELAPSLRDALILSGGDVPRGSGGARAAGGG